MNRIVALLVFVVSLFVPSVGSAGGWAVASLDPLPPVQAGASIDVGFRLLQHGRTPVVASEWGGATIGLGVRVDGKEWFVPATMEGGPGHYVATVEVPSGVSTMAMAVQMRNGLLVDEGWAQVTVSGAGAGGGGGADWLPSWTAPLFALAAAGCASMILVEVRSTRRRRDAVAATPLA